MTPLVLVTSVVSSFSVDRESKYYQTEESLSFLLNFDTNKQQVILKIIFEEISKQKKMAVK